MQEIDPRTHLAHFDARMWADPDLQTLGTQEQRYDTQDIDKSPQNCSGHIIPKMPLQKPDDYCARK